VPIKRLLRRTLVHAVILVHSSLCVFVFRGDLCDLKMNTENTKNNKGHKYVSGYVSYFSKVSLH
jgi:hypothetical protein